LHLLEAENISKYYGNIVALRDVSTYVDGGEVTCILGDNGAGKSSFIKILSGVHQHDEGRLLVDGEEVRFASPRRAGDYVLRVRLVQQGAGTLDRFVAPLEIPFATSGLANVVAHSPPATAGAP